MGSKSDGPSANQVNEAYLHLKKYGVSRWDTETALKKALECDPYPWKEIPNADI